MLMYMQFELPYIMKRQTYLNLLSHMPLTHATAATAQLLDILSSEREKGEIKPQNFTRFSSPALVNGDERLISRSMNLQRRNDDGA